MMKRMGVIWVMLILTVGATAKSARKIMVLLVAASVFAATLPHRVNAQTNFDPWIQFAMVEDDGSRGWWEAANGDCTQFAIQLYNNDANVQAVAQKLAEKYGEPYGPTRCFWSERYNWDNWDDNDGAMLIWSWHVPNEVTYDIDGNPIYSIYPPGTKAGIIWVRSDYYGWSAAEALMLSSENEIWFDEVSKVEQPDMPGIEMPKTRLARALLKPPSPLQNAMLHAKSAPTVQNAVLRTKVSGARFQPAAARPMIQLSGVGNSTWMKFWVFDWLPFKAWAWLGYGWTRYEVQYIIPQSIKFNPAGFYSCMAVGNNIGTLGIGGCPTAALLSLILPIPGPQAAVFGACTVAGVMCAIGNLNVKFK